MTTTTFVDQTTIIQASWLNDVNQNTYRSTTYTATAGQTVLTVASYENGSHPLVFLNGLLQAITQDYTETNSTTITFVSGLTVGDRIVVRG